MVIVRLVLQPHFLQYALSLENFQSILKTHITDILFAVLLYYILFVQRLWMAPASKGIFLHLVDL